MAVIQAVHAREILDSRGIPTIETTIILDTGIMVSAAVPSGTSTGKHEAVELRDGDQTRMLGKGVLKAVKNVNEVIAPAIIGQDPSRQTNLDQILVNLDGTPNKSKLGSNAMLSVSQAGARAGAAIAGMSLYQYFKEKYQLISGYKMPIPAFNLINGGAHGAGNLDFQEFHVVPASNKPFHVALQIGAEIFMTLEKVLISKGAVHSTGIEGGFAPNLYTNTDAFQLFFEAVKEMPYVIGQDVFLGIDAASNYFYSGGKYKIRDRSEPFNTDQIIEYYKEIQEKYHVFSIEDGLAEDDWDGWKKLTKELQSVAVIVGDDFLTTNKERVLKAVQEQACTGIIIKPNQIGTISETVEVVKIAKDAGWQTIFSHRSGETTDDFMADFAVGCGADYVKFGAPSRGERVVKYNRLLKIEAELGM
ncbi:MAG: phosphopyruvate hydratase [Candidatus Pacebacteria bacterium]|nr:phosphopyruvate hydratase [Candidatus Paceibacterota bacterium]